MATKLDYFIGTDTIQNKTVTRIGLELIKQDTPVDNCLEHDFEVYQGKRLVEEKENNKRVFPGDAK